MKKLAASKNCFVCGRENTFSLKMEFFMDASGEVSAQISFAEQYEGYPGIVHGGVIAAVLDEAAGRACVIEEDDFFVTSELNTHYRKPVPVGEMLEVRARLDRRRGRVAFTRAEITSSEGTILADAEGVFVEIGKEKIKEMNPDALGWRVYPDEQ